MRLIAEQIPFAAVGGVYLGSVDFGKMLDSGELLTGTPTVTEITTADLTISDVAVNTAALEMFNVTKPIGTVVQFKMIGQADDTTYLLKVTATTDATPAQTLVLWVQVTGVDEP